jgi:N-acetylmuramoyl-L-alanine amidase
MRIGARERLNRFLDADHRLELGRGIGRLGAAEIPLNAADLVGGVNLGVKDPYLARTLLDLSQTATINDSLKLGKDVLGELGRINTLHKGHVEQAGFAVLKAPDIPSILIETAFLSNPEEEARLTDEDYQDKLAEAILKGLRRYFAKNPPLAKSKLALAGK